MSVDKDAFIEDFIDFMERGANDEFAIFIQGILEFVSIMKTFAKDATDGNGNKFIGFTGAEMATALGTLTENSPTSLSALQLATGLNQSFDGKDLETTNIPGGGVSAVSNKVTDPITVASTQSDWQDFLEKDFQEMFQVYVDLGVPKEIVEALFRYEIAKTWADFIERGVTESGWTFEYVTSGGSTSSTTGKLV